ncbi:MAG: hypothetical protein KJ674_03330, partial [Nanoarchaeota archaeon]|nr:hypothetical protein [Nanoarchaeota archaeon]
EYMLVYAKNLELAKFNAIVLDEDRLAEYKERDENGNFKYEPLMYSRFVEEKMKKSKDKYFYPIYVSQDLKEITLDKKNGYFEVWPINKKRKICWKVQKIKFGELLKKERSKYSAIKDKDGSVQIYEKYREGEGTKIKTHWIGKRYNATTSGTGVLKKLLGEKVFSYPKSLYAILDTLKIMTSNDDIILDFFAGSGTTGHATLELNKEDGENRKFILVEQLDEHIKICKERIKKVMQKEKIKNSFVHCELMKYNELFVEKIQKAKNIKELLKIWKEMKEKSFLNYNVDIKKFDGEIDEFKKLSLTKQKHILFALLNKNQLYVNLSEIGDKEFKISNEDKNINKEFYKN